MRDLGERFGRSRRLRPNGWTPEEVERRIVDEDVEWAYVFEAAGRQVLRKRGTANGVTFAGDELPLLRDAHLVHHHPPNREFAPDDLRFEGGSFSERDLDLVLTYDVAEVRAVTPGWRYVLTRPESGWLLDADSAVAAYGEEMVLVRAAEVVAVGGGFMTWEYAQATRAHRVMQRLAEWGRF
jgi:hypothetical protein